MASYIIRQAQASDLDIINYLASTHKRELGFVRKVTLEHSITHNEILVAEMSRYVVGFMRYHHRRDAQTTLYDIVVSPKQRCLGIGEMLIKTLAKEASSLGKQTIILKCPVELHANDFYDHIGLERWHEEPGKKRKLVVWRLSLM